MCGRACRRGVGRDEVGLPSRKRTVDPAPGPNGSAPNGPLVVAQRLLARARAEAARAPAVVAVREAAPEAGEVRAAQAAAARDRRAATEAELRAARAERELRETVAALRGEARRLTAAELAELRTNGPGGPAVMAEALKALAAALRTNNPARMQDALRRVAQAAVTWQERI